MGKFTGYLILSDMDGTLLNSKAEISCENRNAVKYFSDNGGFFSVATGRVKLGMKHYLHDFKLSAPAVIYNGAVIYDFDKDTALDVQAIGLDGYKLAVDLIERFSNLGVEVSLLDDEYVAQANDITKMHFEYVKMAHKVLAPHDIPQPWVKLNLTLDPLHMPALRSYIKSGYGDNFFAQHSMPYFYEISKKGANKGSAALKLSDILGVRQDKLYTIGDGLNDVELLSCTKNSYAPENAEDKIKSIVSGMLPSNDEHCVAELIKRIESELK